MLRPRTLLITGAIGTFFIPAIILLVKYNNSTTIHRSLQYNPQQQLLPPLLPESTPPLTSRHAVVHVGPPKTATTSLQSAMTRDTSLFAQDGYFARGPFHELAFCLNTESDHYETRCTQDVHSMIENQLAEAQNSYKHLFISSEGFGDLEEARINLARALRPWNDVTIIITYRRFFQWIASKYNTFFQMKKKPLHRGGKLFPSIAKYMTREQVMQYYNHRYVNFFYEFYREQFENVKLFNVHDVDIGYVPDFYCNIIPDATNACNHAKRRAREGNTGRVKNQSSDYDYERMARMAHRRGLLEEGMTVAMVINNIRQRLEVEMGLSQYDLPQECVDNETLDLILLLSLEVEKRFFPVFFASPDGEIELRAAFEKAKQTTFCNVDVETLFMDDEWKFFFRSMRTIDSQRV